MGPLSSNIKPEEVEQLKTGWCGIAAIKAVLLFQFNIKGIKQRTIANRIFEESGKKKEYKSVADYLERDPFCTTPTQIADSIRYYVDKYLNEHIKVFCSRNGSLELLDTLYKDMHILPIIHQYKYFPDKKSGEYKLDGHYMIFGGVYRNGNGTVVKYLDVAKIRVTHNMKPILISETAKTFLKDWYHKGERWYMIAVPYDFELEKSIFKGKFL